MTSPLHQPNLADRNRNWSIAFLIGVASVAGHLLLELLIWLVLFYGFGYRYGEMGAYGLFALEHFQFSYCVEVFCAALGGVEIWAVFGINRFKTNLLREMPLCLLSFALGGLQTSVLWLVHAGDLFSLALNLVLPLAIGFAVIEVARYQERKAFTVRN